MFVCHQPTATSHAAESSQWRSRPVAATTSARAFAFSIGPLTRRTRGRTGWDRDGHGAMQIGHPPR